MSDLDQTQPDTVCCSRCGQTVQGYPVARYEHDDCETPVIDETGPWKSIRRLHLDTARLLHRMGYHEEAAWHEARAHR